MSGCEWERPDSEINKLSQGSLGPENRRKTESFCRPEGRILNLHPAHASGCWQTTLQQEEESLCCAFLKVINNESKRAENGQQITFGSSSPLRVAMLGLSWQDSVSAGNTTQGVGIAKQLFSTPQLFPAEEVPAIQFEGIVPIHLIPHYCFPTDVFFTLFLLLIKSMSSFYLRSLSKK